MAQKLVDPNSVAPEFRDAAVKRRNEQIKLAICAKKAEEAKVLRRDRAEFVDKCMVQIVGSRVNSNTNTFQYEVTTLVNAR